MSGFFIVQEPDSAKAADMHAFQNFILKKPLKKHAQKMYSAYADWSGFKMGKLFWSEKWFSTFLCELPIQLMSPKIPEVSLLTPYLSTSSISPI